MAAMTIRERPGIVALGFVALLILPAAARAGTLTASPSPLEFTSVPVGDTQVEAVTLENDAEPPANLEGITLEDEEPPGQFAIEPSPGSDCGETVQGGHSCVVEIVFHPTAGGEKKATLVVRTDPVGEPVRVALIGLTAPQLAISPFTFDFGPVNSGSKSSAKQISVENRGSDTGVIEAVTLSGADADQFEITDDECAEALGTGGRCSFAVLFAPTSTGSKSASVMVASNAPESPQALRVSGTGVSSSPPAAPLRALAPAKPSNAFSFGKVIRKRRGTASLAVRVPGPGSLLLSGKGIIARRGPGSALVLGGAGTARLTIAPTGRKERSLLRTGRAKVVARVTFVPAGGDPLTKTKKIRLIRRR